jgi:hypothetical protein
MQSIAKLSEFAGHLQRLIRATSNGETEWTDTSFGELALKLFELQREFNQPYRKLCHARGNVNNLTPQDWKKIPAVPTSAFKDLELTCLPTYARTTVFHSSGTTQHRPSRHFHNADSLAVYEESLLAGFSCLLKIEQRIPIASLTPPREAAPHSSLVYMFETLRRNFGSQPSLDLGRIGENGSWNLNLEAAVEALRRCVEMQQPFLILGTAFSYVQLLDYLSELNFSFNLPAGSRVMETGGYKGRSRTMPKDELHHLIYERLGISPTDIVCEYGMSELSSQAYDQNEMRYSQSSQLANPKGTPSQNPQLPSNNPEGIASFSPGLRGTSYPGFESSKVHNPERVAPKAGYSSVHGAAHSNRITIDQSLLSSAPTRIFHSPPWARVQIISPETGRELNEGETGLIRVFDLANVFSVMAIQTEDLGIRRGNGFELVGRASLAEARGCSLMAV